MFNFLSFLQSQSVNNVCKLLWFLGPPDLLPGLRLWTPLGVPQTLWTIAAKWKFLAPPIGLPGSDQNVDMAVFWSGLGTSDVHKVPSCTTGLLDFNKSPASMESRQMSPTVTDYTGHRRTL